MLPHQHYEDSVFCRRFEGFFEEKVWMEEVECAWWSIVRTTIGEKVGKMLMVVQSLDHHQQ